MRLRQFHLVFLIISIFTVAASCKKVDIQYGNQALDNQYTQVIKVDTFTVNLSTVFVDSFATSGTGVTLLGGYTDTAFGRIDTKCYFDLQPPPYSSSTVYDSTSYDSLRLILKLTRNYYGDTTQPLHIDVSRLSQQIILPINTSTFYNVDQFPISSKIGSGDFIVSPTSYYDTLSVPLNDDLGKELLGKLKNGSDLDLHDNSNFLYYFNGLRLSSNSSTNLILNCKDSLTMRLSYHKIGPDTLEHHHVDFVLNSKQHHFNNITVDRSSLHNGLQKIGLNNDTIIPSSLLNNRAYSQYASGVATKITFPTIYNLLKVPNYSKILTAQLKVIPVKNTWDTYYFLPQALNLATTNLTNVIGSPLVTPGGYGAETGNLVLDYIDGDNTAYTYDVSNFLKSLIVSTQAYSYSLTNPPANNYGLLLVPPSPASITQFSRIIVGDQNQPLNFRTILEIYYLTIQPK